MALLTGMTEDGREVPVQVDGAGRLVAEGLQGPPGQTIREIPAGSPAAPGLPFVGDQRTGLFSPRKGVIGWAVDGLVGLVLTEQGRLGVGTENPTALLHLNGEVQGGTLDCMVVRNRGGGAGTGVAIHLAPNSAGTGIERSAMIRAFNRSNDTGSSLALCTNPSAAGPVDRLLITEDGDHFFYGASSAIPNASLSKEGQLNVRRFADLVYADNAAAKNAGLVNGDLYRKPDGTVMVVFG